MLPVCPLRIFQVLHYCLFTPIFKGRGNVLSVVFFSKIVADGWLQTFLCFVVFLEGLMDCFSADWPSYLMFVRELDN